MFSKGEYIIYGSRGVCEVSDITTIKRDGVPDDRLYYLLTPVNTQGSTVFTPVDNEKTVMRALMTLEEAEGLIRDWNEIEELQIPSEKQREQSYKDCLRTGQCREYIRMIKTLYHRKQARVAIGKKITSTDERYLKQAEDALYSELSQLYRIPKAEIPAYVRGKVETME